MSLKKNLFLIYLVYFSRATVYLLLLPLLIRRLGDGWGQVATILSFIQIATTAIEFGFGVSATKSVARNKSSTDYLGQIASSVISIQLALFLVVFLIGLPLIYFPVLQHIDLYLYVMLIILFQGSSPLWFLKGMEDMVLISSSEVISKFIVLSLVFFTVNDSGDIDNVYISYLIGALIPVLVSYSYIYKRYTSGHLFLSTLNALINQFKDGSMFFGVRLSGMFVGVGGSLMLGAAGHIQLAGTFAIAERILSGIRSVLMPAWDVLFPKVISLFSKNETEAKRFRKKATLAMILFSFFTSLILYIFAPLLVQYFSASKDLHTIFIVQVMSLAPFLVSVINSFGLTYLVSKDRNIAFLLSIILGALLYFSLLNYLVVDNLEQVDLNLFAYSYDAALALTTVMVLYFVVFKREKNKE